jgi:hypothetical protein
MLPGFAPARGGAAGARREPELDWPFSRAILATEHLCRLSVLHLCMCWNTLSAILSATIALRPSHRRLCTLGSDAHFLCKRFILLQ